MLQKQAFQSSYPEEMSFNLGLSLRVEREREREGYGKVEEVVEGYLYLELYGNIIKVLWLVPNLIITTMMNDLYFFLFNTFNF